MQELLSLVAGASSLDTWSLIMGASAVVKAVMLVLVAMSIFSWYVIVYKYLYVRRASRETDRFIESFWKSRDIEEIYKHAQTLNRSPVSTMFLAGYTELAKLNADNKEGARDADLGNIVRALRKAQTKETIRLESLIPFLATTGAAGPFIGLFGTVWGIMNSFKEIGAMKSATIAVVAPGIAEALIATAIGLIAAIPAVMAFNYFQRRIQVLVSEMETFEHDYLNIIRRHFLK